MQASNATYRSPDTAQPAAVSASSGGFVAMCRDCVVTESAYDEPWAPFCRRLRRPALLLADAVEVQDSE